jgi:hypothetical protein
VDFSSIWARKQQAESGHRLPSALKSWHPQSGR